jgi:nucleoside-triphosphatase
MHILITGKPRTGKTTLIKKIIRACGPACGGFYTEEMTKGGERRGFLIRTTNGTEGVLAEKGQKSPHRLGKYGINRANLEQIGVGAVEKALQEKEIIVIDEIGKMELFSQKFKGVVMKALDSKKKVVGVIHLAKWPFLNAIRERDDILLLEVDGENNAEVWEKIKSFLPV